MMVSLVPIFSNNTLDRVKVLNFSLNRDDGTKPLSKDRFPLISSIVVRAMAQVSLH